MGGATEEPVRVFAEAITSHDLERALSVCHPEIEFLSVLAVSGLAYVGHGGIRKYFDDIASAWEEWSVDVHRVTPAPDGRVAIVMTMRARGKGSGAPLSELTAHVWTLKDGKLLRNEPFRGPDEAVRAAGLDQ
jgi:ketosteroid isomerase-like protein